MYTQNDKNYKMLIIHEGKRIKGSQSQIPLVLKFFSRGGFQGYDRTNAGLRLTLLAGPSFGHNRHLF